MRQTTEHLVHGRYVDPFALRAIDVVAHVHTIATACLHADRVLQQPATGMSPEHQPVVVVHRGIVAKGIAHHLLHHVRVAGIELVLSDAHLANGHLTCQLAILDACQPRLFTVLAAAHEDQQCLVFAQSLGASLHLLQI